MKPHSACKLFVRLSQEHGFPKRWLSVEPQTDDLHSKYKPPACTDQSPSLAQQHCPPLRTVLRLTHACCAGRSQEAACCKHVALHSADGSRRRRRAGVHGHAPHVSLIPGAPAEGEHGRLGAPRNVSHGALGERRAGAHGDGIGGQPAHDFCIEALCVSERCIFVLRRTLLTRGAVCARISRASISPRALAAAM